MSQSRKVLAFPTIGPVDVSPTTASTTERLCTPDHWRLEAVWGATPGYLLLLLCADQHIHYAALPRTYPAARATIRRWVHTTLPPEHGGLPIEDRVRERLLLPDGRAWPLARPHD